MPPIQAISQSRQTNKLQENNGQQIIPQPNTPPRKNKKNKLLIVLVVTTIIIILLGLLSSIIRTNITSLRPVTDNRLKPTVTPIPTSIIPSPVYGEPSEYSNDPQILQLEGTIKNLQNQIIQDDFSEPEIAPPVLEKNLKF